MLHLSRDSVNKALRRTTLAKSNPFENRDSFARDDKRSRIETHEQQSSARSTPSKSYPKVQEPLSPAAATINSLPKRSSPTSELRTELLNNSSNRGAFSVVQASAELQHKKNATESGSWSQSKGWMSQSTKERRRFEKMTANLVHLGAGRSEFVPKSPAELAALRAEMTAMESKRLSRQLSRRMDKLERKKLRNIETGVEKEEVMPVQILLGKRFKDGLSTFFASTICFRDHILRDKHQGVPWPTLAEFKEEGDKKSLQCGRKFPLPRLGIIAHESEGKSGHSRLEETSDWRLRTVKIDTQFLLPVEPYTNPRESAQAPSLSEILLQEVPEYLQTIILEIWEDEFAD
ncbi:hypothetical protein QQS21_008502 [Conoideocrella luteorostrata]|uniref:Uncharacterized protein n=1 Tax=Conoideocrella luteorostrata TaxID=1105319 RepID=A0AAJ0CLF9_9HYPO|nr:hypothetical protein QQS21_008502 [Conoideocrella luteorostrata]